VIEANLCLSWTGAGRPLEAVEDGIAVLRSRPAEAAERLTDDAVVEIGRLLARLHADPALRV
jgi:hypothetical protein